jgi:hypothetical protein
MEPKGSGLSQMKRESSKREPSRGCRTGDLHPFNEEQDQDLNPHPSESWIRIRIKAMRIRTPGFGVNYAFIVKDKPFLT